MTTGRALLGGVVLFLWGLVCGTLLSRTPKAPVEAPAAAVRLSDGGLVLERVNKPAPSLGALPKGAKVERVAEATILPAVPAAPVHVTVGLLETPEGRRVVVKSKEGQVITGQDFVIPDAPRPMMDLHWSAGILKGVDDQGKPRWAVLGAYSKGRLSFPMVIVPGRYYGAGIAIRF